MRLHPFRPKMCAIFLTILANARELLYTFRLFESDMVDHSLLLFLGFLGVETVTVSLKQKGPVP